MKIMLKLKLIAICCSAAILLSACQDDNKDRRKPRPKANKQTTMQVSERKYSLDNLPEAKSIQVMTYHMPNVQGKTAKATAMLMFPQTPQPKDGWRVVVWGHGTVGIGDRCAPSNNALDVNFKTTAAGLLKAGYVIVAPDFEGLGTSGIHPYLNLGSASRSASYAMIAIKQLYQNQINGAWMSVGQSQGGHAALGIAEYANDDRNYKGTVAAAPASSLDIIALGAPMVLEQLVAAGKQEVAIEGYAGLLTFAAYATVGIKAYEPLFNYKQVFEPRSGEIAAYAEGSTGEQGECLAPLYSRFSADIKDFLARNKGKTVLDYPALNKDFNQNPSVKKFLLDNQPGTKKIKSPLMIIQGTADEAIPYVITVGLKDHLIELGTALHFVPVEGASHSQAIVQKNDELLKFVQQYMPASSLKEGML